MLHPAAAFKKDVTNFAMHIHTILYLSHIKGTGDNEPLTGRSSIIIISV